MEQKIKELLVRWLTTVCAECCLVIGMLMIFKIPVCGDENQISSIFFHIITSLWHAKQKQLYEMECNYMQNL